MGMSLGSGKVKELDKRATLLRRTAITYGLKRPSSRQILSEIVKKFGTFPFSLRQLDDEKAAKVGVIECVRSGVLREYKPAAEADGSPVSRIFTTIGTNSHSPDLIELICCSNYEERHHSVSSSSRSRSGKG